MRPPRLSHFLYPLLLSGILFALPLLNSCTRGEKQAPAPGATVEVPVQKPGGKPVAAKRAARPIEEAAPEVSRSLFGLAGPVSFSPIEGGVMMVSAFPAEHGRTEIDWRRLSPKGALSGPTRVLHTVPGIIRQIAAVPVIDRSAVVWCSENDKGAIFFGVLWVSDWGSIEGKADLGTEDHAPCHFALLREPRGAVVVHMAGKKEPCDRTAVPETAGSPTGLELCPDLVVQRLAPGATPMVVTDIRLEHHRSAEDLSQGTAADADILFSAVTTERTVLITANVQSAAHKPQVEAILLPNPGEPGLDTILPQARHDALLWTGDSALIVGQSSRARGPKEGQGLHATVWKSVLLGADTNGRDEFSTSPWPRIKKTAVRCDGGKLRVELQGERGLRAVLDPQAEGASFSLAEALSLATNGAVSFGAALWSGGVLLTWDRAGSLVKRNCAGGTIDLLAPGTAG